MTTVDISEFGGYSLGLYKATVKLAGGTDTVYIIACDAEDAVQEIRKVYADLNVLYIESLDRLAGSFFVSEDAEALLKSTSE